MRRLTSSIKKKRSSLFRSKGELCRLKKNMRDKKKKEGGEEKQHFELSRKSPSEIARGRSLHDRKGKKLRRKGRGKAEYGGEIDGGGRDCADKTYGWKAKKKRLEPANRHFCLENPHEGVNWGSNSWKRNDGIAGDDTVERSGTHLFLDVSLPNAKKGAD